jgi:Xaa-Pro aminopeptidase
VSDLGGLRPLDVAGRIPRLRQRFDELGVEALVVTNPTNVRYLTGFTGSAGIAVITGEAALLVTDGRYRTQSAEQLADAGLEDLVEIFIGGVGEQTERLDALISPCGAIGLEADDLSWSRASAIEARLERSLVATSDAVEELRAIKDQGELDRMRQAASIADAALEAVLPLMRQTGSTPITETEFALALDSAMRRGGAESVAFETIVAAGENSAKPHHHPSDRSIQLGDPVVVDFGATFQGYRSDMTRSFVVGGQPSGALREIFELVAESQAAGVAAVRPGVLASSIDEVCRSVIAEAGLAERFEHSTGHGVGLDIHELPWVSARGTSTLVPRTVVTVEPGVYVAGVGGVRIEDTLVVTDDGAEALTRFSKEVAA